MTDHSLPPLKALPLRLPPGVDLRSALEAAHQTAGHQATFVLSGIGSLSQAQLRFAGRSSLHALRGDLEILTLAGTIAGPGAHLHISLADADGRVWGGHVAPGCLVRTTAEVLLVELPAWNFSRALDPATGFMELVIRPVLEADENRPESSASHRHNLVAERKDAKLD